MVDLSTQLIHSSRLGELLGTVTQMLHRTRDERSLNMILYSPGKGSFCFYLDMRLRPSIISLPAKGISRSLLKNKAKWISKK